MGARWITFHKEEEAAAGAQHIITTRITKMSNLSKFSSVAQNICGNQMSKKTWVDKVYGIAFFNWKS